MKEERSVQVIKDLDGEDIVVINDIIFKGKKHIKWKDVENYLKKYIGDFYEVTKTKDVVFIGNDFPGEFSFSKYTKSLNRSSAKTKANLINSIPIIIEKASNKTYKPNSKTKHNSDASLGWYRYITKFAFPSYDNVGNIIGYKIYKALLIIRITKDNQLFLYDIIQIYKE